MGCSFGFKYAKNALAAGAPPPDPTGSSRRSRRPLLVGWGGGHHSQCLTPFITFGASILTPWALRLLDNSRTGQLADSQVADKPTSGRANSQTVQVAHKTTRTQVNSHTSQLAEISLQNNLQNCVGLRGFCNWRSGTEEKSSYRRAYIELISESISPRPRLLLLVNL